MAGEKDPFDRPLDTATPIVLTPEQAKERMAEVAAEEAEEDDDDLSDLDEIE